MYIIQLIPAFSNHPEFESTYYSGYFDFIHRKEGQTFKLENTPRFKSIEAAEEVVVNLLNTLSCRWTVIEEPSHEHTSY